MYINVSMCKCIYNKKARSFFFFISHTLAVAALCCVDVVRLIEKKKKKKKLSCVKVVVSVVGLFIFSRPFCPRFLTFFMFMFSSLFV